MTDKATASAQQHMDNLERVTTERLVLCRPRKEHAEKMFERYASDPQVTKFVCWPTHDSVQDTLQFIETISNAYWKKYNVGPYLIHDKETGKLLGATGLDKKSSDCATTGYVFAKDSWGRGYATEVLKAIIALAHRLEIEQVVAECHVDNVASQHVLTKCGFQRAKDQDRVMVFPNLGDSEPQTVLSFVHNVTKI